MDALQSAVLRAKFAKGAPRIVHEPPRPIAVLVEAEPPPVPPIEEKSVHEPQPDLSANDARFMAIERQLSQLMHMVGAGEESGVVVGPKYVMAADVRRIVAEYYGFSLQEIAGPSRHAAVSRARMVAYFLCRKFTMLSLPKIGKIFSRDHTSVLVGAKKISDLRPDDETLNADLTKLEDTIQQILRQRREAARAQ